MFVLRKRFLFAKGLNWDQSCLWKTPPSRFLLFFTPLACQFFKFFSSPHSWGVNKPSCKNSDVFGENWQRNQFQKLDSFFIDFSLMLQLCHSVKNHRVQWLPDYKTIEKPLVTMVFGPKNHRKSHCYQWFSDQKPLENHWYQWFWRPKTIIKPLISMVTFNPLNEVSL